MWVYGNKVHVKIFVPEEEKVIAGVAQLV